MADQEQQESDPQAAQEDAENALLGDADEAGDGPEERVSEQMTRENEE